VKDNLDEIKEGLLRCCILIFLRLTCEEKSRRYIAIVTTSLSTNIICNYKCEAEKEISILIDNKVQISNFFSFEKSSFYFTNLTKISVSKKMIL
jgi:predicted alpha/beta-fold hydrolase